MLRRIAYWGFLLAVVAIATHAWAAEPSFATGITRAEAVRMTIERNASWAARAADIRDHMPPLGLFWDTDQQAWYAPALEVAFEEEFAVGYGDASFRPGAFLTQRDALLMITRSEDAWRGKHSGWEDDVAVIKRALEYQVRVAEPVDLARPVTVAEFLWMFPDDGTRDMGPSSAKATEGRQGTTVSSIAPSSTSSTSATSSASSIPWFRRHSTIAASVSSIAAQLPFPVPSSQSPVPQNPSIQYASRQPFAIAMPSLGILDLTISHPSDPYTDEGLLSVLDRGVGHLFSYPGDGGVVFVYGHSSNWSTDRSGYAKIFRQINTLSVGDLVYVTYNGNLHVYQIMSKGSVPAHDMAQFADSGNGEELLLYTCWPPDSISERYLVRAQPVQVITL